MAREQLTFGNVPVPYAASWTAEEKVFVADCPHSGRKAICQEEARGEGKPLFGRPHANRQREVIALDLCDLCAKPLKNRTKVSLSHARPRSNGASAFDILQVEPLLHKECAAISMRHCPSLHRDVKNRTLEIRQVIQHRVQFAIYSEQGTFEATGQRCTAISHAKVHLLRWKDRDERWLLQGGA
jgi:hypothetical protein